MSDAKPISEAEWQVMQVIWDRKSAFAADVIADLSSTEWSHRTIRTLLSRLVEKGVLTTESDGNRYVYRPTVSRTKCVKEAGRSFLDRVFEGDTAELLLHFARHGNISSSQLKRLHEILNEKQENDE